MSRRLRDAGGEARENATERASSWEECLVVAKVRAFILCELQGGGKQQNTAAPRFIGCR